MTNQYRRATTIILVTAVFAMIAVWASFAEEGDPILVLPEKSFDFGYVSQNVSVAHPFIIKNAGGDSLYILNIKPG